MNNRNFAVGLFVAIALTAFVSATIWLTGKQGSEPTVTYSMYFETDVSGLMLGGPVFFLGVEVGTVTAMSIIPGDLMRVRVDARVLKSAPINSATFASLALQGITGVAVIRLSADPGGFVPLVKKDGETHPVIVVRDTGFSALLAKAPNVVDKLDTALVQINQILGSENRKFISTILGDLAKVSTSLAAQEQAISEIPATIQKAVEELHSSLAQIKGLIVTVEPNLSATLANLDQASNDLRTVSGRLDNWTGNNDEEITAFMQDGLRQVPALLENARVTLREIEKLVKDLREDPSQLVYKPNEEDVDVEQ